MLDFWTLCCINCIHVLPDLAKLEKKYPNELVVVGVHSPKFDNEKESESIRKAILRYEIAHPVLSDANRTIWGNYGVESWPTLFLIDSEGNARLALSGEGNYDVLDRCIAKLIREGKEKKTLNDKPIKFELARTRKPGPALCSSPARSWSIRPASAFSSPTAPITAWSLPICKARRSPLPATALPAAWTATLPKPASTTRKAWPSRATPFTWPTGKTT